MHTYIYIYVCISQCFQAFRHYSRQAGFLTRFCHPLVTILWRKGLEALDIHRCLCTHICVYVFLCTPPPPRSNSPNQGPWKGYHICIYIYILTHTHTSEQLVFGPRKDPELLELLLTPGPRRRFSWAGGGSGDVRLDGLKGRSGT